MTFGYYSTRGVPLNAYDVAVTKIAENIELSDMIKLLNLNLKSDSQELTYENIVIASDADNDRTDILRVYILDFSLNIVNQLLNKDY